jgi:SP family arabinose:H+ symporter-like MFS transporter
MKLSGINAVLYFAPRIFEMTGLSEKTALLQPVGIGVTNLIFTFVGLWLIDKLVPETNGVPWEKIQKQLGIG